MPYALDPAAVRSWCALGREALGAACAGIDAINVFPVADGDTGTNLCLTFEAAARAAEADGEEPTATAEDLLRAMAHAALLDARGNSGTILAQYLRGLGAPGAPSLAHALRRAADSAYEAVAHPVEGTMLTVAAAAADGAAEAGDGIAAGDGGARGQAAAAERAARAALEATTGQLAVLGEAGVVDAGAAGLVTLLSALSTALGNAAAEPAAEPVAEPVTEPADAPCAAPLAGGSGAAASVFEVMYLLETDGRADLHGLRAALDALGDSLVIGGGEDLWSVHVHTPDAGAAVEAGIAAGRPYRIRVTHLAAAGDGAAPGAPAGPERGRAVVAVVPGDGLAGLCEEAGATVVPSADAARGETLLAAIRATGAGEVLVLPNGTEFHPSAARAVEEARAEGVRAAVIPTRAAVQGLAALAVHAPERRFDEDVVTMTSAAGATRYGEVTLAERQSWTMAGICQAGDVLGLVDGDVAVIGADIGQIAMDVLARMLAGGGEMVTLVLGEEAPEGLAGLLEEYVRRAHLAVDTVVYEGRRQASPLLVGVE
ncbi:DAK2 domain-containing protein [Streptomyces sp. NPDC048172]|uniref:DAK2 domain-containing protein n=1 Tax=Streptomyces sp. NPDC048172 TaxID=3365505 RepID=UPI00371CB9A9